jgi:iron(III) transport system permease protein
MTVTNIYLVPTYTENLYSHFAASGNLTVIAPRILPLIVLCAGLILLAAATLGLMPTVPHSEEPYRYSLGRYRTPISIALLGGVALLIFIPLLNLVVQAGMKVERVANVPQRVWSVAKFVEIVLYTPYRFGEEFRTTRLLATSVTLVATSVAITTSWRWRNRPALTWGGLLCSAVALAIPAPLVGVLVIRLLNQPDLPLLTYLYDRTLLPPLLAILPRTLPLAWLMFHRSWATLEPSLCDHATLEGAGPWRQLLLVALPLRRETVMAVAVTMGALAAGDLAASLLTLPPGMFTLSQRMFGLVHAGVDDQVAGLGLWCWFAALLVAPWVSRRLRQPLAIP